MQSSPYWWDDAPLATLTQQDVLPACDVAIVGAGYTGLSAAITLARAGRSAQVFDKQRLGEGASTRNGGITSGNLRPHQDANGATVRAGARGRDPRREQSGVRRPVSLHRRGEHATARARAKLAKTTG